MQSNQNLKVMRFFSKFRIVALIIMTFLSLWALFRLRTKEYLLEMLDVLSKPSVSQLVNGKPEIKWWVWVFPDGLKVHQNTNTSASLEITKMVTQVSTWPSRLMHWHPFLRIGLCKKQLHYPAQDLLLGEQ